MKRILCMLLTISLLLGAMSLAQAGEPGAADPGVHLADFLPEGYIQTPDSLLYYAEEAISAGEEPKQVGEELMVLAEEHGVADQLLYMIENIAAYDSEGYNKMLKYCGVESGYHALDLYENSPHASGDGFNAFGEYQVSDALKALFADESAQYNFQPVYWFEKDIKNAFGTEYKAFKPSDPRPGYACVIISSKSRTTPKRKWNKDEVADEDVSVNMLNNIVNTIMERLGEDAPVLTGNPNLASEFWEFSLTWPLAGKWKFTSGDVISGYNSQIDFTIVAAEGKRQIGKATHTVRLPHSVSVYGIPDYLVPDDLPELTKAKNFSSLVTKTKQALEKERASAAAGHKITTLNAQSSANALLLEQAEAAREPWARAIFEAGAKEARVENNSKLVFRMRGFMPDLSTPLADTDDPGTWLMKAMQGTLAYDMEVSVPLKDGQPTQQGLSALKGTVQKAANAAQQAFSKKDFLTALTAWLFPQPLTGAAVRDPSEIYAVTDAFAAATEKLGMVPEKWAPLFYAQIRQTLLVKNGPHAMTLTCQGADGAALIAAADSAVLDEQAYLPAAERASADLMDEAFCTVLAKNAVAAKKGTNNKIVLTLDTDLLAEGLLPEEYQTFIGGYTYDETLDSLKRTLVSLPDEAAQPLPKNGKISGPANGTQAVIKNPADGMPVYMQVQSAADGAVIAECFVLPGKDVTLKIPAGEVRLVYMSGRYWYGDEQRFGPLGVIQKSETEEIQKPPVIHTFTLQKAEDDGLRIYDGSQSDFH